MTLSRCSIGEEEQETTPLNSRTAVLFQANTTQGRRLLVYLMQIAQAQQRVYLTNHRCSQCCNSIPKPTAIFIKSQTTITSHMLIWDAFLRHRRWASISSDKTWSTMTECLKKLVWVHDSSNQWFSKALDSILRSEQVQIINNQHSHSSRCSDLRIMDMKIIMMTLVHCMVYFRRQQITIMRQTMRRLMACCYRRRTKFMDKIWRPQLPYEQPRKTVLKTTYWSSLPSEAIVV